MSVLRKLWALWKAFAHRLGQIQTTILLTVVYVLAIGVVALVARLRGQDLLGLRRSEGPSYWAPMPPITSDVEHAQKQF